MRQVFNSRALREKCQLVAGGEVELLEPTWSVPCLQCPQMPADRPPDLHRIGEFQVSKGEIMVRNKKGFTLIELLIVVVIIGILAAIAIPKFANTKEKAIVAQMRSDLRNMVTAQEAYISDALTYYNGPIPSPLLAYGPSGSITITLSGVSNT